MLRFCRAMNYGSVWYVGGQLNATAARRNKSSSLSELESVIIQDTISSFRAKSDRSVGFGIDLARTSGRVQRGRWRAPCGMSIRYDSASQIAGWHNRGLQSLVWQLLSLAPHPSSDAVISKCTSRTVASFPSLFTRQWPLITIEAHVHGTWDHKTRVDNSLYRCRRNHFPDVTVQATDTHEPAVFAI